jgi:hypothetical protein
MTKLSGVGKVLVASLVAYLAAALYYPAFLSEVTGTFSKFHPRPLSLGSSGSRR